MSEGDEIQSDRHRADALDEMNLPSRFRGLIALGVVVALAAAAIFFVRGLRSNPPAAHTTPVIAAAPPPVPPEPPALVPNSKIEPTPGLKVEPAPPVAAPSAAPAEKAAPVAETPEFAQLLNGCQEAFNGGRIKDAITICSAAKDADPGSAKALALLSHAEFNRNHRKDALAWAEKAVKIDPALADAYVIIGGVQQESGRNGDAKNAYKKYLELAPKGQYASDLRSILETL